MRNLHLLDKYRAADHHVMAYYGWAGDESCGVFRIPSPIDQKTMTVVASVGAGWDHVSVSRENRCPNWIEMSHIKGLFFQDAECAMQLHVPTSDHVNDHPNCLHLWRPHTIEIPRPPKWMIGGMSDAEAQAEAAKAMA